MVYPIRINSIADAYKISNLVAQSGENISINYGSITLDPRSVLGLAMLIGKDALLVGPDHMDPSKFASVIEKIGAAV